MYSERNDPGEHGAHSQTCKCPVFRNRLAGFDHLSLFSKWASYKFRKSRNALSDHKGPENMKFTIIKLEETFDCPITKICQYNFDPFKPHFYVVKLGFTGVYIIFLISAQKYKLWVLVRTASPRRFKRIPTIYILSINVKKLSFFCLKFSAFGGEFSIYLNRRVFVMGVKIWILKGMTIKSKEHTHKTDEV